MTVQIGDRVLDLAATTDRGEQARLSELVDDFLVVFFYPRAFTGGCTAQACHFRDLAGEFDRLGAARVGVSSDEVATQARFRRKHAFDFPLLSDADGAIAHAFGVSRWGPLPNKRHTYVLDRDLRVIGRVANERNMQAHADEALDILRRYL